MKWSWLHRQVDPSYSIYTTEFDVEVSGDDLQRSLASDEKNVWLKQVEAFEAATELERTKISLKLMSSIDKILKKDLHLDLTTTVSIVVDHSGSLKGQRAIIACFLVQIISDFFSRLGVKFEILGFTTVNWKGGQSRERWAANGRARKPGRLNDLMHICYRKASDSNPGAPWSIYHLLRSKLLKENIDGEAVFWAAERLKNLSSEKSLILVISDGAPVDDSTLLENDPEFLWKHLQTVISDVIETPGFRMAGLGIDHDVSSLYPLALRVDKLEQISADLPEFLENLFE